MAESEDRGVLEGRVSFGRAACRRPVMQIEVTGSLKVPFAAEITNGHHRLLSPFPSGYAEIREATLWIRGARL